MKPFLYLLGFLVVRIISFLPLRILFLLSDILWPLVYYVFRYRRTTVFRNLKNAFPHWTENQVRATARKFYLHFTDLFVETVKTLDYSPAQIRKRMKLTNPDLLDELYQKNKSILLVASHYGNWEWLMGLAGATRYHTIAVYKPLKNKRVDNIMKRIRSKAGTELVSMRWVLKRLRQAELDQVPTLALFVADQSPVLQEVEYWTTFLNQETAVYTGIEKLAIRFNHAVVFCKTRKVNRGFYETTLIPVSVEPKDSARFEITNHHLRLLEELILEEPSYWLWSHRRWKLKRNPD